MAVSKIACFMRIDFSFNGTPNSDNDIITNVPLNGWVPVGVIPKFLNRVGWRYSFHSNSNVSNQYWLVHIETSSSASGSFQGRICAIKTGDDN